jgi:hypothetical protein
MRKIEKLPSSDVLLVAGPKTERDPESLIEGEREELQKNNQGRRREL